MPAQRLAQRAAGRRLLLEQQLQQVHLDGDVGRVRIAARIEALIRLARREPGAIETVTRAVASIVASAADRRCAVRAGASRQTSAVSSVSGVIGQPSVPMPGAVGKAVIPHQSAGLDLRGEMPAGALHAVAETGGSPADRAGRRAAT